MTFGRSPVTQHPWWEQTAMVYLLQMPVVLAHAAGQRSGLQDFGRGNWGYISAAKLLSQRHLNGYPPIIAAALRTHEEYQKGDFIVSFSGCRTYTSQEVCNMLV